MRQRRDDGANLHGFFWLSPSTISIRRPGSEPATLGLSATNPLGLLPKTYFGAGLVASRFISLSCSAIAFARDSSMTLQHSIEAAASTLSFRQVSCIS